MSGLPRLFYAIGGNDAISTKYLMLGTGLGYYVGSEYVPNVSKFLTGIILDF